MVLFNNYAKPGPGVDVNAPKKKGIALFVEIFGRKFFQLIKANFVCFIISIPFIAVALLILAPQISDLLFGNDLYNNPTLKIMIDVLFAGTIFNFFGSGPVSAAYAYVTRSFTRSQPVWVVSDGFDKFKENFRQSIGLVVIDMIIIFLGFTAFRFYGMRTDILSSIACMVIVFAFAIYTVAHIFMYQIMITYECKFKDIIKNSLLMTMAKLPMCVLLVLITGILCVVIFGTLGFFSIIVYATIGMSLTRFPLEFYAARVIEKL